MTVNYQIFWINGLSLLAICKHHWTFSAPEPICQRFRENLSNWQYVLVCDDLLHRLIKWVSNVRPSVCPSVCTYVRPSVHKCFIDFDDIWHVGRDQWVMHDGIQYDRSKVKVTNPSKWEILPLSIAISSAIYNGSWQLTTDSYTTAQFLNLIGPDIWYLS